VARSAAPPKAAGAYKSDMAAKSCEIFFVRREGKLRWKWRATPVEGGAAADSSEEYELFYDCLSVARDKGFTPMFGGLRLLQPGDAAGLPSQSRAASKNRQ
jgi:hypothetical protein